MKTSSFVFPVVSFRNLETPFTKSGYKNYYAVVDIKNLPDLSDWRRINVRDPKLSGAIPKAIKESAHDKQDVFLFMNRGIVIAVDSVSFDNKKSTVTINLKNREIHGLLDGGHTYKVLMNERDDLEADQYVKLEILEGFKHEDITNIVDARNTSNQVRDESLMNLAGEFEKLKKILMGRHYSDLIAYKEYEETEDGQPKPIDIRDVIAILTVFDKDNFGSEIHPINAYRSKAACLEHFKNNSKSYEKLYPIANDILELYDEVQFYLPDLYNEVRGKGGEVTGGKFGKLTGVTLYKGKRKGDLLFVNKETQYGVPSGFVYPVLGAFRALLEEKGGRYIWGKKLDPKKLLRGPLGLKLADTIGNFALDAKNPSKTGKSPLVWQACYQAAEVVYLKS